MFGWFDRNDARFLAKSAIWVLIPSVLLVWGAVIIGFAWRLLFWAAGG